MRQSVAIAILAIVGLISISVFSYASVYDSSTCPTGQSLYGGIGMSHDGGYCAP